MTPCEERGLREGQWVWCVGIGPERVYWRLYNSWVLLIDDDGSEFPYFRNDPGNGPSEICLHLNEDVDFTQGIHDDKPNWTPKEYGGEGPPAEWTGDGLPPVGTVCEYHDNPIYPPTYRIDEWRDGDELEVVAHRQGEAGPVAVVWNRRLLLSSSLIPECLRPICTERERVVDAALSAIEQEYEPQGASVREYVENGVAQLYDAGFLRDPKESDNG